MELSFQQLQMIANRQSFILANGEKLAVEDSPVCQGGIAHIKVRFPFEIRETGEVVKIDDFYKITLEEGQLTTISPINPSDTLAYIEGDGISRRELMENPFMRPDFRGTVYPARVVGYHSSNNGNSNGSKKYSKYMGNVNSKYSIGIELEAYSEKGYGFMKSSNWMSFEQDSSLSGLPSPFEMVTCPIPVNLAIKEDFWMPLTSYLTANGVRSYKASATGLHCHIGKDAFSSDEEKYKEEIGRLCFLYQTIIPLDMKADVFGRGTNTYCKRMDLAAPEQLLKFKDYLKNGAEKIIYNEKINNHNTRYYELNLQTGTPTIEFRRGKGSVNASRIASIVAFCATMVEYSVKTDISNMNLDSYISFAKKRLGNTHPLLSKIYSEC